MWKIAKHKNLTALVIWFTYNYVKTALLHNKAVKSCIKRGPLSSGFRLIYGIIMCWIIMLLLLWPKTHHPYVPVLVLWGIFSTGSLLVRSEQNAAGNARQVKLHKVVCDWWVDAALLLCLLFLLLRLAVTLLNVLPVAFTRQMLTNHIVTGFQTCSSDLPYDLISPLNYALARFSTWLPGVKCVALIK